MSYCIYESHFRKVMVWYKKARSTPKVAMDGLPQDLDAVEVTRVGSVRLRDRFRRGFYACLDARADALLEVAEAVVRGQQLVRSLAELSLEPEHQRGHDRLYDELNAGRMQIARVR
jgi:hypothetical protein